MKKIKVLFSFLILLLALYGCGGSSNSVSTKESSYDDYEYDNTYNKSNSVGSTDSLDLSDEQMYSYKASARVQSLNYDESYNKLKEKIKSYGGILQSETSSDSQTNWYRSEAVKTGTRKTKITLKVPSDKYEDFINSLGDIGRVLSKTTSVDNVTVSYDDAKSRIESLTAEKERLNKLMNSTNSVNDMIVIEDRLEKINYQLAKATTVKDKIDGNVKYSTVNLTLEEVKDYTEERDDELPFISLVKKTFVNSWRVFYRFIKGLIIVIISVFPFALFGGAIVLIGLLIAKSTKKKKLKDGKLQAGPKASLPNQPHGPVQVQGLNQAQGLNQPQGLKQPQSMNQPQGLSQPHGLNQPGWQMANQNQTLNQDSNQLNQVQAENQNKIDK